MRYLNAVFSQGIVSVFHFVVNIVLVRLLIQAEYGVFALAFSVGLIFAAVTNSLFTVPLSVRRPAADESEYENLDRDLGGPAVIFAVIVAVVGGIGGVLLGPGTGTRVAVASVYMGTYMIRNHARGAGYAHFDVTRVLRGDAAYVAFSGIVLALAFVMNDALQTSVTALAALSLGNLVSTLVIARAMNWRPRPPREIFERYQTFWADSRWALVGAIATMVVIQGHSVVIGSFAGAEAFAPIAAGFVLFGPVRVLFSTIQNVLRPEMAKLLAEADALGSRKLTAAASAGGVVMVVGISVVLLVLWNHVNERLFVEQYAQEPMGWIVAGWGLVALVGSVRVGPNALLQAQLRFGELAIVGVVASVVNLVLVALLVVFASAAWTIPGVAVAEGVMALLTIRLVLSGPGSVQIPQ